MREILSWGTPPSSVTRKYPSLKQDIPISEQVGGHPECAVVCWQPFDLLWTENEFWNLSVPMIFDITNFDSSAHEDLFGLLRFVSGLDYFLDFEASEERNRLRWADLHGIRQISSESEIFAEGSSIHLPNRFAISRVDIKEILLRVGESVIFDLQSQDGPILDGLSPVVITGSLAHLFASPWASASPQYLVSAAEQGSVSPFFRDEKAIDFLHDGDAFFNDSCPLAYSFDLAENYGTSSENLGTLVAPGGLLAQVVIGEPSEFEAFPSELAVKNLIHTSLHTVWSSKNLEVKLAYLLKI